VSEPEKKANASTLLSSIASSGSDWVKIATLVLVGISGTGNFWRTGEAERVSKGEAEAAVREIHDLHNELGNFERRQREILDVTRELQRKRTISEDQP
jgi:hypothetical protein